MKTALWSLDRIKPYDKNPRLNDQAVDAVAASIKEFGVRQPLVVDEDGVIVVGHTRYKAAQKLGMAKVPVHVATGLTPEQIKAYRIADNQSASLSDWNHDLLALELSDLRDLDFDIDLLGFGEDELAKLFGNDIEEGLTDPDAVPEPPDNPVTKPGDLWILGNHRLLCGDSSKPEDVDRLLDDAKVHLVNTDPPYNVRVEPRSNNAISAGLSSFSNHNKKPTKKNNHKQFDLARHPEKANPTSKTMRAKDRPLVNDYLSDDEFDKLLDAWFGNIARVLQPGRAFYIWGGYGNLGNYPPFLIDRCAVVGPESR
ncbi:MAG: ParB N-terminal domain-containing protein [Pirellulales bacterium]|nr:ParB N-terminal domain-containing protein [Pirellulales bacterium]